MGDTGRILLAAIGLMGPCFLEAAEIPIQNGSIVAIHYVLTVDHKVVDSSKGKKPLVFVQGAKQIVPGLEEQIIGLRRGDKKHIVVQPEKGYGAVLPNAFQHVRKQSFPNAKSLRVGSVVTGQFEGQPVRATVIALKDDQVTLDLNHPLAGKVLEFDIEIADVKPPGK